MKWIVIAWAAWLVGAVELRAAELTPVFTDKVHQFTGVAVAKNGRMFVNFPRWQSPHPYDVVEVRTNGKVRPFPNIHWNNWSSNESGTNKWVCVQAVWADESNGLWVVDSGAPEMKKVEGRGAKLVWFDLKTNQPHKIFNLAKVAGGNSYLNDVRVDLSNNAAYMTESKNGGLVVVDIATGAARLVLNRHFSTKADPAHKFLVDGKELMREGKPMPINSDGIALSPDRQWLFYKPLSDTKLYKVPTAALRDPKMSAKELASKVVDLGTNFTASDGMIFDTAGNLYLSDIEHDSIVRVTPALKTETVAHDPKLLWPDTFTWGMDGSLYVSCSQIQNMAWFHDGKSARTTPYVIYKLKPD